VLRSGEPTVKTATLMDLKPTRLTWDKSIKRDLKEWNISKDLAMNRSAWRLTINVPEP
jgi:hypothetical protein